MKTPWRVPDPPLSDDDILKVIERRLDKKLSELWGGSTSYHNGDDSRADISLCCKLIYWIGRGDAAQIDRLFRQSRLFRPKWDSKRADATYGSITVAKAIAKQTKLRPAGCAEADDESDPDNQDPEADAPEQPKTPPEQTAHDIILAYFRERYRPVFRRGPLIYSEALRREVKAGEATQTPDINIITRLSYASDAPVDRKGDVRINALPTCYTTWAKVAWGTLIGSLDDEEESGEVSESAASEFRSRLGAGLLHMMTLGESTIVDGRPATDIQRRPVLHWCVKFARGTRYQAIRGYSIWTRIAPTPGGIGRLEVALRSELFAQMGYRPLSDMGQNRFTRLCENYNVGTPERASGKRAVVLTDEFLHHLLVEFPPDKVEEKATTEEQSGCN